MWFFHMFTVTCSDLLLFKLVYNIQYDKVDFVLRTTQELSPFYTNANNWMGRTLLYAAIYSCSFVPILINGNLS